MKILAVCGFGLGSSMVLKRTIERALKELNVEADVEISDVTSARGERSDLVLTSTELAGQLSSSIKSPVIPIDKYLDLEEVKGKLEKHFNENK